MILRRDCELDRGAVQTDEQGDDLLEGLPWVHRKSPADALYQRGRVCAQRGYRLGRRYRQDDETWDKCPNGSAAVGRSLASRVLS